MNNELYEKLMRLQWLFHKQHLRDWAHGGHPADQTRGQGRILAFLKLRDNISTKDLSYLLGMAISSLNEMLSKLEKNGYIVREVSDSDKRIMLVKLTGKGRVEKQSDATNMNDIFVCLSDEEQRIFSDYLDRIMAAMKKHFEENGDDTFDRMKEAHERLDHKTHKRFVGFEHMHGPDFRGGDRRRYRDEY
jgi:DNA-binding MarR family transcriptional regulator